MHPNWTLAEGQHPLSFEHAVTQTVTTRFQLYLPHGYGASKAKKWPLIVFLHGSGEGGDDIEKVTLHGLPNLLKSKDLSDFPFIVVSPQSPENADWDSDAVNALIDELIVQLPVDADRIYLTGLSLGGFGTWSIAAARPERFAAIAPICGAGEPATACRLKSVPVWAFHGEEDAVVALQDDQAMVDAARSCGADVKFTIYPGVGHDSWTRTYADPALYAWFLQHRRQDKNT
jgi:predicted peptidase